MQANPTQLFLTDVAAAPVRVLSYEPRRKRRREQAHTWWAAAALVMAALTLAYAVSCAAGVRTAFGWELLAWLVYGFIGTWIGCGVGVVLALVGCVQWTRLRRRAVLALLVNLALAGAHYAFVCAVLLPSLANRSPPSSSAPSSSSAAAAAAAAADLIDRRRVSMKRELIALAVAGVSVLGCESSGLSPREVPGRSQPGLLYGMYENLAPGDGSAAAAAPAKPLRLPVSVAVVQVGEVAPPQPMIDALRKDPAVFARVEALPYVDPAGAQQQSYRYYNSWEQGPPAPAASPAPRPSLAAIRRLAADTGMDYVLLVGGTIDHGSSGTPLSLLDITIVGGFIVPSRETRGTAVASAALIDVPTGRVIVNSSAEARRSSLVPTASVSGERAKLLQAIRDDVVKKLGAQVLADVRQRAAVAPVAGAVPQPAPLPAAAPQPSLPTAVAAPHVESNDWQTVPPGTAYQTR